MPLFRNAAFHVTVASLHELPADSIAEIAFAGRSNAGKSSAINSLADHSRLAYVSKMPGRTQYLNYFALGGGRYFVDLPGYGFAKAPADIRAQWDDLLAPYLQQRSALRGMVLIMDSRHPLSDLDLQMLEWFANTGKPVHVLLSKADKLTRNEQARALADVKQRLPHFDSELTVQLFSSLKRSGIDEVEHVLSGWLGVDCEVLKPAEAKPAKPGKLARPRRRNAIGWSARRAGKDGV